MQLEGHVKAHVKVKFLAADVVYQYDCIVCDRRYVGYTERPFNVRSAEHSCRNSTSSRAHGDFGDCFEVISKMSFKKIARGRNRFDLKTKEAFPIPQ